MMNASDYTAGSEMSLSEWVERLHPQHRARKELAELVQHMSQPDEPPTEETTFQHELTSLINRRCLENGSNTPDFILAQFLINCLMAFNAGTNEREAFFQTGTGVDKNPVAGKTPQHGVDCPKVEHTGSGYLHAEDDDAPYDVDGLPYCGRCHQFIEYISHAEAPTAQPG